MLCVKPLTIYDCLAWRLMPQGRLKCQAGDSKPTRDRSALGQMRQYLPRRGELPVGRQRVKTPDSPVKDPRTARGKGGWTNATICPQGEGAMGRDRINFANHTADSSLNRRFASKFGFDSAPQFPRKARKPSNRTSYFVHPLVHHTHNYAC